MYSLDVPLEVVRPTEKFSTGWERTHQIPYLEMLVLVVSMQVCSEAGAKRATLDLTGVLLLVHGAEVFATQINKCSRQQWGSGTYLSALLLLQTLAQLFTRHVTLSTGASVLGSC
jgi:hypothetical protein